MRGERATRRAALAAVGIVFFVLAVPLFLGQVYFGVDLSRSDLGVICALKDQVRAGIPGGIARTIGNGIPLRFEPAAQVYYPLRWLVLAFPAEVAASLEAILHLALSAGAAAWLARTFRVRPFGAACAGVAYGFSGTVLNLIVHGPYQLGALYIPLSWAIARRSLGPKPRRWMPAALALSLALALLGGEPQTFLIAAGVVALEALRALIRRRRRARGELRKIALAVTAAVGLGMILWTGARAEIALGRGSGIEFSRTVVWSMTPDTWIGIIAPSVLAQAVQPGTHLQQIWSGKPSSSVLEETALWNDTPYLGMLLLAAAVAGALERRARMALYIFIGAAALSLGSTLPIAKLIFWLTPQSAQFRYPAKYFVVVTLAGVILGAIGFDSALGVKRVPPRPRRLARAIGLGLVLQVSGAVWVLIHRTELDSMTAASDFYFDLPKLGEMLSRSFLFTLPPLAAALALIFVRGARPVLPLVLVADYLLALPTSVYTGPPMLPYASPMKELKAEGGEMPVVCHGKGSREGMLAISDEWSLWTSALNDRLFELPNVNACDGLSDPNPYGPLQSRTNAILMFNLRRGLVSTARALGCTHILAQEPPQGALDPAPPLRLAARDDVRPVGVWSIADPIPPAFIARAPRLVDSEQALVSMAQGTERVDELLALADDPLGRLGHDGAALPAGSGARAVRVAWLEGGVAELTATGTGAAVLGIRTAFHAGWTAEQAGRRLLVVRIGGTQVAAVVGDVAAGPVRFSYRYPDLWIAVLGAAIGLALLSSLYLWPKRAAKAA